ncbi:ATP-binding cassette, subfamily B (MDR/TAP), member 1 [Paragonimus westermani]|uniref:ATP-binding cassette, subfamily B (MDR/TAP), member 1 n=2 Tax=Paragonimus westermani TaxID=34504 RepID=A0A5J4NIP2_9TREM|nr:ATP-binding cassette, subfamily B (MDR/TAP), member 1 [Paragonimus westermani]
MRRRTRADKSVDGAYGDNAEKLVSKKEIKTKDRADLRYKDLFRYATRHEMLLIISGTILSALLGTAFPLTILVFRLIVNDFMDPNVQTAVVNIYKTAFWFLVVAICAFLLAFLQTSLVAFASNRIVCRIRLRFFKAKTVENAAPDLVRLGAATIILKLHSFRYVILLLLSIFISVSSHRCRILPVEEYMGLNFTSVMNDIQQALLRQDVPWFDQQAAGILVSQLTEDIDNIHSGIGVKLTEFVQNISSFIVGLCIAFGFAGKLTLVACTMLLLILAGFGSFGGMTHYFIQKEADSYAKANAIAEEVFRAIRTVIAFGGEDRETVRYAKHLDDATQIGIKQATCFGFAGGFIGFSVYSSAALVFWYGISLLLKGEYDAGSVVLVFLNVIIGSLFLGGALPNFRFFYAAKLSAKRVFQIIERVLENFNVTIEQHQTVAFIGPSGCGKSTVMHLLQRFYDPVRGKVMVGDLDLRQLDLHWFRSQIGVVQQEPVIFTGTIAENIRMGNLNATDEQVIEAAKLANAHHFITSFPNQQVLTESEVPFETSKDVANYECLSMDDSKRVSMNTDRVITTFEPSAWIRVMQLNRPETAFILLGSFSAALTGAIQPMFAVLYSEIYAVFTMADDPRGMSDRVNFITGIMVVLGFLRLASNTSQAYFFGVAGQRLTKRLRRLLFQALLQQEMAWFDNPNNQVGALTSILASEANKVHPLCGSAMGRFVESGVLLTLSLFVAFFYNWKLTLVVVVFFPVIVFSSFLHIRQLKGTTDVKSEDATAQIAYESLSSNRTVTALGIESHFYQQYSSSLNAEVQSTKCQSLGFGFVYALAQSLPICSYAAAFSFGAYLMSYGEVKLVAIFKVFAAISFAAQALGRTSHLGPDIKHAVMASSRIFRILDRKSRIPTSEGVRPEFPLNTVPIEFKRVSLRYETRSTTYAIKNFSHVIRPAQTVALVGHSGCGKTSLFKLLQRLYNCSIEDRDRGIFVGTIRLDEIAPNWIRRQVGVVDQEPHLFNLSMRENIAYGDNTREVNSDEIVEAARRAQIHDFIFGLPLGYDTLAGPLGSELSVGQKQRIAIARMLIHRPNLLLLDEATSALDSQTERGILAMLGEVAKEKTVLLSAHRLSNVERSDLVVVLADGVKVEVGTPDELLRTKGAYYSLYRTQMNT